MSSASRPRHSWEGYVQMMQMSLKRLWIFVEGSRDRPFYAGICDSNASLGSVPYEVALAEEVPGFSGNGKSALLGLYCYLSDRRMLISSSAGGVAATLFMLDKDLDDSRRTMARSPHVVYTHYFSMENYLFRFGKLCTALAAAARLDAQSVRKQVGTDPVAWTRRAATNWKPWVKYCVLVNQLGLARLRTYGLNTSPMHGRPYGAVDGGHQRSLYAAARTNSGLRASEFRGHLHRVSGYVDRLYSRRQHDRVFNGKWYKTFLAEDAKRAAGGRHYSRARLQERIADCLLTTLNFRGRWAARFHRAIDRTVGLLEDGLRPGSTPGRPRVGVR